MNDLILWQQAAAWAAQGHTVRLAVVAQTWGSAPCPQGSVMMVREDGHFVGSVSGGCVEGAVLRAMLEQPSDLIQTLEFKVSTEDAWAVGLACGGEVSVQLWPALGATIWEAMASHMVANEPVALRLTDEGAHVLDAHAFGESQSPPHWLRRSGIYDSEDGALLTRAGRVRLIISGAVHIAQALCTMALCAGFECVVVDPRPAFAQAARFEAGVTLLGSWPQELPESTFGRTCAVIAVSHDPKIDDPLLMRGFEAQSFYVGALGSRKNQARRQARLLALGATAQDVERVDGPIGLDIGALGAPEIAVSILAKVIDVWRGART